MTSTEDSDSSSDSVRTKVGRLIEEYNLEAIGVELEKKWTSDGPDRMSLRDLATYFNTRILKEDLESVDVNPLAGEVENTYRLLTDNDVTEAERTRAVRRLERKGLEPDRIIDKFVTYQAIRSYLKDERGASYSRDDRDRTSVEAKNIQQLRGRLSTVTEQKLDQLRSKDDIRLGDYRLLVDVNVLCEDCGRQYEVDRLLENKGCNCESNLSPP